MTESTVPNLAGLPASESVADNATSDPVGSITDPDGGAATGATTRLSSGGSSTGADVLLSDTGLSKTGTYSLVATSLASVQTEVEAMRFTPVAHPVASCSSVSTRSGLIFTEGSATYSATNTATAQSTAPTVTGQPATETLPNDAMLKPFGTISDSDTAAATGATITLTARGGTATDADRLLPTTGLAQISSGLYSLPAADRGSLTSVIEALTFTPTAHQAPDGELIDTIFSLFASESSLTTSASTVLSAERIPCYCRGTLILTDRGDVGVEDLQVGDRLLTRAGEKPIRRIGQQRYSGQYASNNPAVLPVIVKAGAFADGVPSRDLYVSPNQAMFLDGLLIAPRLLVNGMSIVQPKTVALVEYFHIELESHDIILAEGALSETFLDDDSRAMFQSTTDHQSLYPGLARTPALHCAPRLDDGEHLQAIRDRIAARAATNTTPTQAVPLRGHIDHVSRDRIEGWAYETPDTAVVLRVLDNGITVGQTLANQQRNDLRRLAIGSGVHGFVMCIPGGLSLDRRHVLRVERVSDGHQLIGSPWTFDPPPQPGFMKPEGSARDSCSLSTATQALAATSSLQLGPAPWRSFWDTVSPDRIAGWACDGERPAEPVALQVVDNGLLIGRILANGYRPDLEKAGIGDGRHGFELLFPGGLSSHVDHIIHVQRESDAQQLHGSPQILKAATSFDASLQRSVAQVIDAVVAGPDIDQALSFMAKQTDRLLQLRADAEGKRAPRLAHQHFRRRWGDTVSTSGGVWHSLPYGARDPGLRALVVDDIVPSAHESAGAVAILSHMRALQQLGYAVSFVAATDVAPSEPEVAELEGRGIACYLAPYYASVEEVLRRQANCFDVIYLHRVSSAARYLFLARQHCPNACILFSVADLHHVRLARQAAIEDRPELMAESGRIRLAETAAAWSADAVLTHSTHEAAVLRLAVPSANVHVVPWANPVRPVPTPLEKRHGLAFVGGYDHAPNVDAARFLAVEIMPLVWQADPSIECLLVGSRMPEAIRQLAGPGLVVMSDVNNLDEIFDRVRLTVAPLRYGAGVKGKVLASFAAGVPCIMSPVAAEGIDLPASLLNLVGADALEMATLIIRLHRNAAVLHSKAEAALTLIACKYDEASVITSLGEAIQS
jgi:hypothetical protein